jgi:putative heme-binding domain-containing protein
MQMTLRRTCLAICLAQLGAAGWSPPAAQAPSSGSRFTVPPGLAVEGVWEPGQSGSIAAITFDSRGRLIAAREYGPVMRLVDTDGDGRVEQAHVVTTEVTNCQGLEFDGDDLLAVGHGPQGSGLYRVSEAGGDGPGGNVTLITRAPDEMQEHGPHAVFWGPDGWLYWIMGNFAYLDGTPSPASPHRTRGEGHPVPYFTDPRGHAHQVRAPGGQILRLDPARPDAGWQRIAGGFRNAYDAAFNAEGELFTFDSDMEWDIGLPWYRPVRTYHVPPGAEFGWRTGTALWPPHYLDALPPLTDVGRGSPTGVAFYNGTTFPAEYRDTFLQADWSRGRILIGTLARHGATYREASREFLTGTPLNVTDLETGPDGAVYFSKGGRKTEGGIYRVVAPGATATAVDDWDTPSKLLGHPHPRSAWGRAQIRKVKAADATWAEALRKAAESTAETPARRQRAIELLMVFGPQPEVTWLAARAEDGSAVVRSAAVYALGTRGRDARAALRARLADDDPFVVRRAVEGLVRTGVSPLDAAPLDPVADLLPLLDRDDRVLRFAARELLERTDRNRWRDAALAVSRYPAVVEAHLALAHTADSPLDVRLLLTRQRALIESGPTAPQLALLLRPVHLTMMKDEGVDYARLYGPMMDALVKRFPTGDPAADRELATTFAIRKPEAALPLLVAALARPDASREAGIWYAYAIGRYDRAWTPELRATVEAWFTRTQSEQWRGGFSFQGNLATLWQRVVARQPEAERERLLAAVPALAPAGTDASASKVPPWRQRPDTMSVTEQELKEYLEFDPMAYQGSTEGGRKAFEKAFCATCHRIGDLGQDAGPDLTDVGRRFKRTDILDAILHPSRIISEQWAAVEFVTTRRQSVVGIVARETPDSYVLKTVTGHEMTLPKKDVASQKAATISMMPEGLLNGLSMNEIRDLLTFLERGPESTQ